MKTHIPGPLCGSNSFSAYANVSDCETCNKRLDELLELLCDVADGLDRQRYAAKLMKRWKIVRNDEET